MFRRLVSNLPFNPSLIDQVGFYADRLRGETAVRRLSFVMMALVVAVQSLAVIAPPERSYAASESHIMSNVTTKQQILSNYDNNADIRAIFSHYGIVRSDLENLTSKSDGTADQNVNPFDGRNWTTIGRTSLSTRTNIDPVYLETEKQVVYTRADGSQGTMYERDLRVWNDPSWSAFKGVSSATGQEFWILKDCGNLAWVNSWQPPVKPTINAACSIAGPIIIEENQATVAIPVRIHLPAGSSIPRGSVTGTNKNGGTGIHIGVTAVGANNNWNVHDLQALAQPPPPDKQTDYTPLNSALSGVTYYDFVWAVDGHTYQRYYVTGAQSSDFFVTINVKVNKTDKNLAVRLLDRDLGTWLPHIAACEVPIIRKDDPVPPPVVVTPELDIRKTASATTALKPGDSFSYKIEYRNKKINSVAKNVVIRDEFDLSKFSIVSPTNLNVSPTGFLSYPVGDLRGSDQYRALTITVRLKDPLESGTKFCNVASIHSSNATTDKSGATDACINVVTPCPYDATVNTNNRNCVTPTVVCQTVDSAINLSTRVVSFKTTVTSSNPRTTRVLNYAYDFGDDNSVNRATKDFEDTVDHQYAPGDFEATVVVTYEADGVGTSQTESCAASISFDEDEPLTQGKTVTNVTQNLSGQEAIDSKVAAGDVLTYTLTTDNTQNYDRTNITISDYVGDVLDYAKLDIEALEKTGGKFDELNNKVVWENVTIPAKSKVESVFTVTLMNPIPATNQPPAGDGDFDCKITNVYGDTTMLQVQCPMVKGIESLPNTGPGTSMIAVTSLTLVVGYFFARSRLLAKELQLIRTDYAVTGGM